MSGRNGGNAVCDALRAMGVSKVFAVASVHNLPILEAIAHEARIQVVNMRHEQGAVHAADGYYRATGRLGVAITSTGPGAANAMGGLFEAYFASSAVLMITGQIEQRFMGQGKGFIHEADHQLTMLRTVTRDAYSPRSVADVGRTVIEAGLTAQSGRPRPTAVEIPVDLQYAASSEDVPPVSPAARLFPVADRIEQAAALLREARRPLIWAGGGVIRSGAADDLTALAERLDIPVVTSVQGRGSLPETHPLCLGPNTTSPGVRRVIESADVVIAIGTRFQMYPTDHWRVRVPAGLIHIDADPSVLGRTYAPAVSVVADAQLAIEALGRAVDATAAKIGWRASAQDLARKDRDAHRDLLGNDHAHLVDVIRAHVPPSGAIVRDATVPAYLWGDVYLPICGPNTSMNPTSAAIGPGLPLAIGATAGRGCRSVVIHGDGGIMLTIGELASLAQAALPLTVLVFNDKGYGVLRGIQAATFGGSPNDVDLHTPDFVGLAHSFGIPASLARTPDEFEAAFAHAAGQSGPYLVEIDMTTLEPMTTEFAPQEILS